MKYDLNSPCAQCPFRSDIEPYVHSERVEGFIGEEFSCHKTTTAKNRGNDHPEAQHCAGALILQEKMKQPHQMMRIMERLRLYDYKALIMDSPVYDSFEEMEAAYIKLEKS